MSLVAITSLVLSACASGGASGDVPDPDQQSGDGVSVQVDNDLVPPASITVFIVPESGGRRRLGSVPGSRQQSFTYNPTSRSMQFYIQAEVVGGSDVRSNEFNLLGDVTRVEWAASRPNVVVR